MSEVQHSKTTELKSYLNNSKLQIDKSSLNAYENNIYQVVFDKVEIEKLSSHNPPNWRN
jgi:hypothetical protein